MAWEEERVKEPVKERGLPVTTGQRAIMTQSGQVLGFSGPKMSQRFKSTLFNKPKGFYVI